MKQFILKTAAKVLIVAGILLVLPVIPAIPQLVQAQAPGVCTADIDGDGKVDTRDYAILVQNFFKSPPSNPKADINKDGVVDLTDYSILVSQFLRNCTTSTPVPTSAPNPTATPVVSNPTATPIAQVPTATPIPGAGQNSRAMGIWNPNPKFDTCPNAADTARIKEIHDSYKVKGPDGKWYPTWHPPVDPATGCKFGHEHGIRNPKESPLWVKLQEQYAYDANGNGTIEQSEKDAAGMPFGYINEKLTEYLTAVGDPNNQRHEDHVGHKAEYANDVRIAIAKTTGDPKIYTDLVCNFISKIHQGTHSKDAFSNNLHEMIYFATCNDGQDLRLSKMQNFGAAGEHSRFCNAVRGATQTVGFADSNPNYPGAHGDGAREIIDRACVLSDILVPSGKYMSNSYEAWPANGNIFRPNGTKLVDEVDLLFDLGDSIRYYYPGNPNNLGYMLDVCYETESNGDRSHGGQCSGVREANPKITWDDPRSPFRGVVARGTYFKPGNVDNASGPTTWYTDPYGRNARTTPLPGYVKQYIPQRKVIYSQVLGGVVQPEVVQRSHSHPSVHAPN